MKKQVSVSIIAKPDQFRDSLQVLLSAIPQIEIEGDGATMPNMQLKKGPDLVLLDYDRSGNKTVAILHQIKTNWSQTRSIVLVDNEQEYRLANAAGADVATLVIVWANLR